MPKVIYSDEDRTRALAIAEATSAAEASRRTGISTYTIRAWMKRVDDADYREEVQNIQQLKRDRKPPQTFRERLRGMAEGLTEEVKQEVREAIADHVKKTAVDLLSLVDLAIAEIRDVLADGPMEDSRSQWLRSVVGVIAQGAEKHQLLMGKPTGRFEGQVTDRREFDITQRIITDPESSRLAHTLLQRVALPHSSRICLDGEQGDVETL